jgi:hypothetical protein
MFVEAVAVEVARIEVSTKAITDIKSPVNSRWT